MASAAPNLKVNIGADTSDFTKGVKEARQQLKDFDSIGSGALSSIAGKFGINTREVEKLTSGIKGAGLKLGEIGTSGASALGSIASAAAGVGAALGAMGLAAVKIAFDELKDSAENYYSLVQGQGMKRGIEAWKETYVQGMRDMREESNRLAAETMQNVTKTAKQAKSSFLTHMGSSVYSYGTGMGSTSAADMERVQKELAYQEELVQKSARAEEIAQRIYAIEREQSDNKAKIAQLDVQISDNQLIYRDTAADIQTRADALAKAQELIRQKYALQVPLATELAALMKEANDLVSSTPEQIDAANDQETLAINLTKQQNQELLATMRYGNTIVKQLSEQSDDMHQMAQDAREFSREMADGSILLNPSHITEYASAVKSLQEATLVGTKPGSSEREIWTKSFNALKDLQVEDAVIESYDRLANSISSGLVGAFDELANALAGVEGSDGLTVLSALISPLADACIDSGVLILAAGTGIQAFVDSLKTLNGPAAIAAGSAMIALGLAAKTGLAAISNRNYSAATTSVASSSYTGSTLNDAYEVSEITVNVEGKLYASGSQLVAVINNEEKRKNHTT